MDACLYHLGLLSLMLGHGLQIMRANAADPKEEQSTSNSSPLQTVLPT